MPAWGTHSLEGETGWNEAIISQVPQERHRELEEVKGVFLSAEATSPAEADVSSSSVCRPMATYTAKVIESAGDGVGEGSPGPLPVGVETGRIAPSSVWQQGGKVNIQTPCDPEACSHSHGQTQRVFHTTRCGCGLEPLASTCPAASNGKLLVLRRTEMK